MPVANPKPVLVSTTEFEAHVFCETISGISEDYGVVHNVARLYRVRKDRYEVEWEAGDSEVVHIGVWVNPHNLKVVDYDGVFSLPSEIADFLLENGFDTSEVTE